MLLATRCPECESSLRIDENAVGKRVRCPKCQHKFEVTSITFDKAAAAKATETLSADTPRRSNATVEVRSSDTHKDHDAIPDAGVPKVFGRFQIKSVLGQGTYGVVYRAFDPTLDREVALKVPKFTIERERMIERFLREAKSAARLRHPNIVGVFESGQVGEDYYIASEFVEGETLAVAIAKGTIEPEQAAQWCRDLADGLEYAHECGIVHRDIKPGNILVDRSGRPRIADFGLAKRINEDATMTTEGSLLGTPAYMSPEQARGQTDKIGPASDQYSLGAVFYQLLTGKRPFEGAPHIVIAKAASADPPLSPRAIRPEVPRDLEAICQRAIEKEPKQRYRDLGRLAEDLQRWLDGNPVLARPIGNMERLTRWCRRNPVLAISMATTIGMIIAAAGGAFTQVVTKLEKAQQVATEAQQSAVNARRTAEAQAVSSLADQRQLAINEFERGRYLCEQGELTQGLLWLSSSLNNLPPEMSDLEGPIRSYIGSWLPHIHQLSLVIPHADKVNAVAISPDGRQLISSTGGEKTVGQAQLWDVQTGARIGSEINHAAGVTDVAFSPDGSLVATASYDKTVRLIASETNATVHTLVHADAVMSLAFSPDGKSLVTGCADEYARFWNVQTGVEVTFKLHHPRAHPNIAYNIRFNRQPSVQHVAFSPDGTKLVTSTYDRRLRVWNVATGELLVGPLRSLKWWKVPLAFHPRGDGIVTQIQQSEPSGARFRDLTTLKPSGPVFDRNQLVSISCSQEGKHVLTSGHVDTRLWEMNTGEQFGQAMSHSLTVNDSCVSADLKTIVTAGDDSTVRVWKVAEQSVSGQAYQCNLYSSVYFVPDGRSFVTSDPITAEPEGPATDRLRVWDSYTGQQTAGPFEHSGAASTVTFTDDGKVCARGNWNSAEFIRMDTGQAAHPPLKHAARVNGIVFLENQSIVVTAAEDGWIRFWEREPQTPIKPPLYHEQAIRWLEKSPDGQMLLTVSNEYVRLWDWKSRKEIGSKYRPSLGVRAASFHPNGKLVAVASNDMTVRFWNLEDGSILDRLIPNVDAVNSIKFLPGGSALVTAGADGVTRIWDFVTCLPVSRPFTRNVRFDSRLDTNREGTLLATFGSHPIVRLYNIPKPLQGSPPDVQLRLERMLGAELGPSQQVRVLSAEEWQSRSAAGENTK